MCGPAPWWVVSWGHGESLDVVKTPLFTRLCHFSHPRVCKLVFGLGIHLTTLSLFEVPNFCGQNEIIDAYIWNYQGTMAMVEVSG